MDKEKRKKKLLGGAEKLRLKRDAELKAAGRHPKQTKLSFVTAPQKCKIFNKLK